MANEGELLTTPEAAVVAGVEVRDVNRLIDEHILPDDLYTNENSRRILAGSCVLIRFYYVTAPSLTAQERKHAIDVICNKASTKSALRLFKTWRTKRPAFKVEHSFLTLNFDGFVADTLDQHAKLSLARAGVVEDPGILGGMPVIKGTRVPVYDVAASVAAGFPVSRIRESYPTLSDETIELAVLYAKASPPRGRPPSTRPRSESSTSRKVARRRT